MFNDAPEQVRADSAEPPSQNVAAPTGSHNHVHFTDQTNLLPFNKVIAVFAGLALCTVVSTLDSVIVATTLPTISSAFNAGSIVSWVPSAYLLTSTSFQPLYGRFSDIFGRKAALCLAMGVFMIGSLAAGFSRTIIELIVFRGIAGAGGGGIISMAQIVVSDIVSLRERGKYQGIIGGFVALGYAIGPIIGGALSEKVSWRWCFWITLPISFCAMCVVTFILPLKPVEGSMRRKLLAVDYLGAGLTLVSCTLVLLPLIWGGVTFPWKSPVVLAPLCSGFLVFTLFCLWESKGAQLPIIPIGFQRLLIPVLVSQMVASFISGVIVTRTGRYRAIIYLGFSTWAIGCGCISTVRPSSSKGLLVFYMLLAGTGAGQTLQTTTIAAQASVSRKDMSVVTAVRNFIRLLGATLSLAVGSTIINNSLRASMINLSLPSSVITAIVDNPSGLSSPSTLGISPSTASFILTRGYTEGFRTLFILHASLNVVATIASVVMIRHKELTRGDEEKLREEARQFLKKNNSQVAITPMTTRAVDMQNGEKAKVGTTDNFTDTKEGITV